ncbi:hypothetical protein FOZ61_008771 [Perkinsus olseni]|uniref:Uncharacterized protein n=1 Tax=Perkinsus olseni TaxID=32597 RepID=A0A7J6MGX7_PEROL|nr:hypothetical protein FOZ61_008771 [Perkinsus olseni]
MGGRLSRLILEGEHQVRRMTRRTKSRVKAWEEATFNTFHAFAYLPYESDAKSVVHKFQGRTLYYETKIDRLCRPFDVTIDINTTIDLYPFLGVESRFVMKKFDFNGSSWIAIRPRDKKLRPIVQRAIVFDIMRRAYTGEWGEDYDIIQGGYMLRKVQSDDYVAVEGPKHILVIQGARSRELWVCHRLVEPIQSSVRDRILKSRSFSPERQVSATEPSLDGIQHRRYKIAKTLSGFLGMTEAPETKRIEPGPWIPMLPAMVKLVDEIVRKCDRSTLRDKKRNSAIKDAVFSRAMSDHIMMEERTRRVDQERRAGQRRDIQRANTARERVRITRSSTTDWALAAAQIYGGLYEGV